MPVQDAAYGEHWILKCFTDCRNRESGIWRGFQFLRTQSPGRVSIPGNPGKVTVPGNLGQITVPGNPGKVTVPGNLGQITVPGNLGQISVPRNSE